MGSSMFPSSMCACGCRYIYGAMCIEACHPRWMRWPFSASTLCCGCSSPSASFMAPEVSLELAPSVVVGLPSTKPPPKPNSLPRSQSCSQKVIRSWVSISQAFPDVWYPQRPSQRVLLSPAASTGQSTDPSGADDPSSLHRDE